MKQVPVYEIPIKLIHVTNRSRKDFGDIGSLSQSIKDFGLMNPVTVIPLDEPTEDGYEYELVAGERRIRASCFIGSEMIKAHYWDDVDERTRKALELEENVKRKDMTWEEQIECMTQFHEIKQEEYGIATTHPTVTGTWGIKETATLLGTSVGTVTEDLKLARSLRDHPELREKVKKLPKTAARKTVKRLLEAEEMRQKVANKGIDIKVELSHGSCLELIDHLPDKSIDCLITDPPFAQPMITSVGRDGYNLTRSNVSDLATMLPLWTELIPKLGRKLKPGAHFYIFTGMGEIYTHLMTTLKQYGFLPDDLPLIWNKMRASVLAKDYSYCSSYEAIVFGHYLTKERRLMRPVANILNVPAIHPQKRVHDLQRPDELLRTLIENSTNLGELILDCFAGSASTLKVARDLQRRAIGFELDQDNYTRALNWLQETA